jgi:hypothetical protein
MHYIFVLGMSKIETVIGLTSLQMRQCFVTHPLQQGIEIREIPQSELSGLDISHSSTSWPLNTHEHPANPLRCAARHIKIVEPGVPEVSLRLPKTAARKVYTVTKSG